MSAGDIARCEFDGAHLCKLAALALECAQEEAALAKAEWLITQVPNHSTHHDGEYVYAISVGNKTYLPGFCNRCEDTVVDTDTAGRWDDGDCVKCGQGGAGVAYSCAATKDLLIKNIAQAMFPDDLFKSVSVVVSLSADHYRRLMAGCAATGATLQEVIEGALIQAGLVKP